MSLWEREILAETQSGKLQRINELNPAYFGLQYPLLFPFGEDGYREDIALSGSRIVIGSGRRSVSIREFLAYHLQERECRYSTILKAKRLFQQFVVDDYTLIEAARLKFIRTHRKQLRCEMYKGLNDVILHVENDPATQGKRIVLPPTFTGGARCMIQNYQDAMTICRWAGYPDLFITLTCNPKWPEIERFLRDRNLKSEDHPDIICRVFKIKLDGLMKDLRRNKVFGCAKAVVYTVEFQKRGLPHAHILLWLASEDKLPTPSDIDKAISAEIPDKDKDPQYYNAVRDFMMHGPCGLYVNSAPCMVDRKCTKHFPKSWCNVTSVDGDGYLVYRRRDDGRTIEKNNIPLDNRFVVPHNRFLLMKYGGHINVEWCNQPRSIKFFNSANADERSKSVDEIKMYYDCRYISSCEAAWRIFGFEIQYKNPPAERLSFHLQGEQTVIFSDNEPLDSVVAGRSVKDSMFWGWMEANKKYEMARQMTYAEFPQKFVCKSGTREWVPRKQAFSIGRIYYVPPGCGESYYMRCLLNHIKGVTCHEDLRTLGGVLYNTYRETCYALGLLDDDKEFVDGFTEASDFATSFALRILFIILLWSESMSRLEFVWEKCWIYMAEDIQYKLRKKYQHPGFVMDNDQLQMAALTEVGMLLQRRGKSLRDFPPMPYPKSDSTLFSNNRFVEEELQYDRQAMHQEHNTLLQGLTNEQHVLYEKIMHSVETECGGMYFVYGYGGTGKTFVWRTLPAALRSKGDIVLNVASSGIASLVLPGGRTAHSRFAIPISLNEDSTCNIKQGSPLAILFTKCKLIIWDEVPMLHKFCFEALDRSMRDVLRFTHPNSLNLPFGGKTIVLGGDFRQVLPVIPQGSRQDVVNATINSSYLWGECTVLRLTKNMRLHNVKSPAESYDLKVFADWIASIGDGIAGDLNDGCVSIKIPDDILIKYTGDPIANIVEVIYPDYLKSSTGLSYLRDRAILAPTLDVVDSINDYMTSLNSKEVARTYLS